EKNANGAGPGRFGVSSQLHYLVQGMTNHRYSSGSGPASRSGGGGLELASRLPPAEAGTPTPTRQRPPPRGGGLRPGDEVPTFHKQRICRKRMGKKENVTRPA